MDIKINRKANDAVCLKWLHEGQEAEIWLRNPSLRQMQAAMVGYVHSTGKKSVDAAEMLTGLYDPIIVDWKGINVDDGEGPAAFPCTPENKRVLLDFDPFFEFVVDWLKGQEKEASHLKN